jgi:hypothetical protein
MSLMIVIILTVFYVYFDVFYINVLIDGMNKNENENEKKNTTVMIHSRSYSLSVNTLHKEFYELANCLSLPL